jgi:glutathionylspermidine synthase
MRRINLQPRQDWEGRVESQGFVFHTLDEQPYWDESACYAFNEKQVDEIERATYEIDRMCLEAAQRVIDEDDFERFGIPEPFRAWVTKSWETDEQTVYGRFDLAYDGHNPPKLLEYNADTPTSLLEAAVIQWQWARDVFPDADQFNSIHDRLIDAWRAIRAQHDVPTTYFTGLKGNVEDFMTTSYLRDTAMQAGLNTQFIALEDIGWNEGAGAFVDERGAPIRCAFKLYPWEWMIREQFGPPLMRAATRWLEPPWKMLLSNKAILIALWEMFPDSPYLLPASFDEPSGSSASYVRKPLLSREGANVTLVQHGRAEPETEGVYGGPYVYQSLRLLPNFGGNYPVIGSWMVNGYASGIGIREDAQPVTTNASRFVPHVIMNS